VNEIEIPDYDPMREIILVVKGHEKRIYKIEPKPIEKLITTARSLATEILKRFTKAPPVPEWPKSAEQL
jgi:hypothetical protein